MYRLAFLLLLLIGLYILDMVIICSATNINDRDSIIFTHTVLFILMVITLMCASIDRGIELCQQEAVEMGHAKYVVDEHYNVKFEWLATQTVELPEQRKQEKWAGKN